ncbi:MAG: SpoIIE family protein phosphatase [bacterium]
MNESIKMWKISWLLLLGLFTLLYIVSSTVVDVYYLISEPVAGMTLVHYPKTGQMEIQSVIPKSPADFAGLRKGDILLKINDYDIRNYEDQEKAYKDIQIGDLVELFIQRDAAERRLTFRAERKIKVYTSSIFMGLLPGMVFCYSLCLIGLFVLLKKMEDKTARLFYIMVLLWALAMWGAYPFGSQTLINKVPLWLRWISLTFWPLAVGLLLHFALIFPVEKEAFIKHRKKFFFLCYGSLILIIPIMLYETSSIYLPEAAVKFSWGMWFTVNFSVALTMLGRYCKLALNPRLANQTRIIYRGTMLTLVIPIGIYFLPQTLFNTSLPYSEYVLLLVVFWPMILAYAIIKHRFMDINFIIKRGLAYALLSGFLVAAYFLFVVGAGKLVLFLTGSRSQIVTIVATLLIAALFNPVKNRIQHFIEKRFFPARFSYREAVRRFRHQLVNVVDLQKLQKQLYQFLTQTMQIHTIDFLWKEEISGMFKPQLLAAQVSPNSTTFSGKDAVIKYLARKKQLVDLSPLQEELDLSADEQNRWRQLKTEIIQPLISKGQLVGLISLGEKENLEPFYKEDIELLETLGDQLNISLENALLTEELREQERLKKELEVARQIQLSSLPQKDPEVDGLDISGVSIPALEVGGDYYDYFQLQDGRFGVVVGDVSGKGTSAALYMSQLKGIIKTASKFYKSLKDLMKEVNAITFHNIGEQSFITLTCGAFDPKSRKFQMVRAGHLPLIYYSVKNKACQQIIPKGIGVGLDRGQIFDQELEEVEFKFQRGDVFLFYSDGIDEARNAKGDEFASRSIEKLVVENGCENALALRDKILSSVRQFSGKSTQDDDMTLVVVKIV